MTESEVDITMGAEEHLETAVQLLKETLFYYQMVDPPEPQSLSQSLFANIGQFLRDEAMRKEPVKEACRILDEFMQLINDYNEGELHGVPLSEELRTRAMSWQAEHNWFTDNGEDDLG